MNHWVILSKPMCPWCDRAKDLLSEKASGYSELDITKNTHLKLFLAECGLKTVPQVYFNGDRIGGYDALVAFFEQDNDEHSTY